MWWSLWRPQTPILSCASKMVDLINQTRAEAGLGALVLDDQLSDAATYRGVHMQANGYFSHYYYKKAMPTQAVNAFGIAHNGIGENIYRFTAVGDPVTAYGLDWIISYAHGELCNSPGHYANIVDPNFTSVGIGIYVYSLSKHRLFPSSLTIKNF